MANSIIWSDEGFNGTAHLWPGQANTSRAFWNQNPAGERISWDPDDLPRMEIPTPTTSVFVDASYDPSSGLIIFVLDVSNTAAALLAGHMFWVQSGKRTGYVAAVTQ